MKRASSSRRRRKAAGSLGIPGLRLPRGVPTLVRSVGRLFGSRKRGAAGAAARPSGGVWIWVVLALALAAWIAWDAMGPAKRAESVPPTQDDPRAEPAEAPKAARPGKPPAWKDGDWVRGEGVVAKVLPDDLKPPRHQRFLVRDPWGRTLLFAHNIDVGRRVEGLAVGDEIRFRGEFKDGDRGGVIHWTHAPAGGRGAGGWIERAGVTYE